MEYEFSEITTDGVRLAFVERGRGQPVLLLHGGGPTDLRTWERQIAPFAERHRVIAYSRRYHYPNPWTGDGSEINATAVHAADCAALVDALRLGPVHLVGFSYGADVALRAAVEYPHLVRTLVLAEPALASWLVRLPRGGELFADYANTISPAKTAALSGDLDRGARLFIDSVTGPGHFDRLPPTIRVRLLENARLIGAEPTDVHEAGPDITHEEAAGIRAPTLLLTGDDSPERFLIVSDELARRIPDVERRTIGAASHLLHVMNPESFNTAVLEFVAGHAA